MLAVIVLLAAWESAVRLMHIEPYLLPPPSRVFLRFTDRYDVLLKNSAVTLGEGLAGVALTCVVGVGAAPVFWQSSPPVAELIARAFSHEMPEQCDFGRNRSTPHELRHSHGDLRLYA